MAPKPLAAIRRIVASTDHVIIEGLSRDVAGRISRTRSWLDTVSKRLLRWNVPMSSSTWPHAHRWLPRLRSIRGRSRRDTAHRQRHGSAEELLL